MTAVGMLLAALGVIFVWAAIKGRDPRDLIAGVFKR